MSNNTTLATKYRPQKFDDIVEQDSIKIILENQVKTNNLKHAYLFCGSAGTGKAQPLDSMVLTPTGYVRMGDVYIGQEVIDGLGERTVITDIFPQGKKPVYKVKFSDNTSVLCSNEHLWKVGSYDKQNRKTVWEVLSVEDLMNKKLKLYNDKNIRFDSRFKYEIPTPIIKCFNSSNVNDPYKFGTNIKEICHSISSKCYFDKKYFGLDIEERNKLAEKEVHSIFTEKIKPYVFNDFNIRLSVLQGILDTYANIVKDLRDNSSMLYYKTDYEEVSNFVEFLVRSLGGVDRVEIYDASWSNNKEDLYYVHNISFYNGVIPITKTSLKRALKPSKYWVKKKIVYIEYVGEQECQCIRVASPDHTYITDNLTVTHNTTSARIIAHMINNYETEPIELDCASHNGVDDVRAIIEDCKIRPYKGRYKVFLLDEVHMLSTQAWNAMLKILEEPPEYVIFLFCTTDPQKVIGTVLSRVQRFNFARISVNGITGRLKYIVECENNERASTDLNPIVYEDSALNYIARLAKGGMRDSITILEKCLDYSNNLTLENVTKVTSGGVTEDVMSEFLCYILNSQCSNALIYFNNIYMSGIDIHLFLKLWTEYLQNCVKYMITQTPEITTLSDNTINWLNTIMSFTQQVKDLLKSILAVKTDFSSDDMKIILESWIIEKCN